jgi:hypothetical protein
MKLATTTGDFTGYTGSQAESLRQIRRAGFHYADYNFGFDYGRRNGVYSDDPARHYAEIAETCAKEGITLKLPGGESRQFDQSRGIIVVNTSGKADFATHKKSINAIYRAYNDLHDELAREWFGHPLNQCSIEELEVIFRAIPISVAEANQN